jgi:hypothetical protein
MLNVRHWVARHSRGFERLYAVIERALLALHPLFARIGYQRMERPFVALEKLVKGFLFDTRMCGSCTLGATGMVCPMNCPKKMRNGPCGGVRSNGHCEVEPGMRCVWVEAWGGSRAMRDGERILEIQAPVDHRWANTSSWLREIRRKRGAAAPGEEAR